MTTGVSLNSRSSTATFATISGSWSSDYPVANLGDLWLISKVAKVTPASNLAAFTFVLPSAVPVQFLAFVRHTMAVGALFRIRLFSDNNPDPVGNAGAIVHDSTDTAVWPSGAPITGYPSTRPYLISSPVTARSGRINFSSLAAAVEFGGLEIGSWWGWPGFSPGKESVFVSSAPRTNLIGGAQVIEDVWTPRKVDGQIDLLAMATAATTGLDFQKRASLAKPFVYVQDIDDATTWARHCWLARNSELPPTVGRLYRHDTFQFRFREHYR